MEHSIALVTGTTSGLGYAAARMLAIEGYRQVIVTGRSLARVQETAARLAAETKTQVFTPLELDLDAPTSVQSALAELVRLGRPIDFLLLSAGWIGGKERVLTAAGIEATQAPLIGHHQPAEPQRADCYRRLGICQRGRTLVRLHRRGGPCGHATPGRPKRCGGSPVAQRAEREVRAPPGALRREKHRRLVGGGAIAPATPRHGRIRRLAW